MSTLQLQGKEYRFAIYKSKVVVFKSKQLIEEYCIEQLKRNEKGYYIETINT